MIKPGTKILIVFAISFIMILTSINVLSVTRTISDTGDTVDTYIRNSKGNYWAATSEANLQSAIWDLNSTSGGWVSIPDCNITLTTTLYGISNLELRGAGRNSTILYLGNAVNKNMLEFKAANHCLITGIKFNFNNRSQSENDNYSIIRMTHGSSFIIISGCSFYNGHGSMIDTTYYGDFTIAPANNITVQNCDFHNKRQRYWGGAISFFGSDCIAKNNFIENVGAVGIRSHGTTYYTRYPQRNLIDGNIITGQIGHGIHLEYSRNCTIVNNILYNLNSSAYNGYDGANAYSSGILLGGTVGYSTVSNNWINGVKRQGIDATCYYSIVTGNTVLNYVDYGIRGGYNTTISNNYLMAKNGVQPGAGIICLYANGTVTNNYVLATSSTYYNQIGIYAAANTIVNGNTIENSLVGIRTDGDGTIITDNRLNKAGLSSNAAILINAVGYSIISDNSIRYSARGIRLYKSHNCTVTGNVVQASGSGYSIYEDTAPANNNSFMFNVLTLSTTKTVTLVGTGSWELIVQALTNKIGLRTSAGTTWK